MYFQGEIGSKTLRTVRVGLTHKTVINSKLGIWLPQNVEGHEHDSTHKDFQNTFYLLKWMHSCSLYYYYLP